MPHVSLVQVESAQGEVRELYNQMIAVRGNVPNLFMMLGHSAAMLAPAIPLAAFAATEDSRLPARYKQLAWLAASRINECGYCLERHAVAGAKAGLNQAQINAILSPVGNLLESEAFDDREKLIIRLAEEVTTGIEISPDTLRAIREVYDEVEFLELVYAVAAANMFNRLASALEVELEPELRRTGH